MNGISQLKSIILAAHQKIHPRVMLVAVSGIDGAGKGFITRQLADALTEAGVCVAAIQLDPWRTEPSVRYNSVNAGEHFYQHAYKFDELFARLIDPLRRDGTIALNADLLNSDGGRIAVNYDFKDIQVILLEGIFLLKRELRPHYDMSIWIDCPFDVALTRALKRNQEGLPAERLIHDYQTIYFPAQQAHMKTDDPKKCATVVFDNRLG